MPVLNLENPVYLDCNATTPVDPEVREVAVRYLTEEFGNEGSRTHLYGARAKQAVQLARDQVASAVHARRDEVIFTSGATESNNLAILGLRSFGQSRGRRHLITTAIEHKAVLEPVEHLQKQGFEVTWIQPDASGAVRAEEVLAALRPETLLVSIMQVNNETGVIQPIEEIAEGLKGSEAFFHVDAAQGFGKLNGPLRHRRVDLISISGHKIYAPKGIGALILRKRGYAKPPLEPLLFGGGQERGLRPGTLPVALIAALGKAAELSCTQADLRKARCEALRRGALRMLEALGAELNGDPERMIVSSVNASIPGLDSEAVMVALKNEVALSNGSACTSQHYTPSHVLTAMGLPQERVQGALRLSWCHLTEDPDWDRITQIIQSLR